MKRTKASKTLSILAAGALVLSACGGSDDTEGTDGGDTEATAESGSSEDTMAEDEGSEDTMAEDEGSEDTMAEDEGSEDTMAEDEGSEDASGDADAEPGAAPAPEAADGLAGDGKKMVMFLPSTSNSYIGADAAAAQAEAEALGFEFQIFENNFDQTEQDQQVQQYLATGEEPAAFLWWPSNSEAGINSVRQLAAVAPVIQFNQGILPEAEEFVQAYAGVDDKGIGGTAGEMALQMREDAAAAGFEESEGGGNMIEFSFTEGYQAGIDRHDSFVDATSSAPFNIIHNEPCGFDAQAGYDCASQVIPKYLDQGIDYIYTQNNNMGVGIVQALKENGLTPGEDVWIVAGDLSGDKTPLKNDEIYSAVIQSPVIEGILTVDTAAQFIANGEVNGETCNVEADETRPALENTTPCSTTFMPNPAVTSENVDSFKIWDMDVNTLVR